MENLKIQYGFTKVVLICDNEKELNLEVVNENGYAFAKLNKGDVIDIIGRLQEWVGDKIGTGTQVNNDVLLENVTERNEINCHTGTEKEELIAFVQTNKGKAINLHFENNISQYWGDDDIMTYYTNRKSDYDNILEKIRTHYIHNIKCVG